MDNNEGALSCLEAFTTDQHLYTKERCKGVGFRTTQKRYELKYLPYCGMVFFNK